MNYISWALLGMAGYSATTLFSKLALRAGAPSSFAVLSVAVIVVLLSTWTIALARGDIGAFAARGMGPAFFWSVATGVVLAIAVISLFRALALGPASVVVPIYGMFIVGGAVLGMIFLKEPVTWQKVAGIVVAVIGVYLIAS